MSESNVVGLAVAVIQDLRLDGWLVVFLGGLGGLGRGARHHLTRTVLFEDQRTRLFRARSVVSGGKRGEEVVQVLFRAPQAFDEFFVDLVVVLFGSRVEKLAEVEVGVLGEERSRGGVHDVREEFLSVRVFVKKSAHIESLSEITPEVEGDVPAFSLGRAVDEVLVHAVSAEPVQSREVVENVSPLVDVAFAFGAFGGRRSR